MAIVTEVYKTREDGVILIRSFSNLGKTIERDGIRYSEAIDPENLGRVYTETDEFTEEANRDITSDEFFQMFQEIF